MFTNPMAAPARSGTRAAVRVYSAAQGRRTRYPAGWPSPQQEPMNGYPMPVQNNRQRSSANSLRTAAAQEFYVETLHPAAALRFRAAAPAILWFRLHAAGYAARGRARPRSARQSQGPVRGNQESPTPSNPGHQARHHHDYKPRTQQNGPSVKPLRHMPPRAGNGLGNVPGAGHKTCPGPNANK